MTEKAITRQALERSARELRLACEALEQCVGLMERSSVPELPLHGKNYIDKLVPQIAKWATKLEGEVKLGVPNYLDGLRSLQAEAQAARSQTAKKPVKAKPKGKKAT